MKAITSPFIRKFAVTVAVFFGLASGSSPAAEMPLTYSAYSYSTDRGLALFARDLEPLYSKGGGAGGGRGFNIVVINLDNYQVESLTNFDTWASAFLDGTFEQHSRLVEYLNSIATNRLVMVAVADEAGLNEIPPSTNFINRAEVTDVLRKFRELGSAQLEKYVYWDAWTLIYLQGQNVISESLSHDKVYPTLMSTTKCYTTFPMQIPDPKISITNRGNNQGWSLYRLTISDIPKDRSISLSMTHDLRQNWQYYGTIPWHTSTYTVENAFGPEEQSIFFRYELDKSPLLPR